MLVKKEYANGSTAVWVQGVEKPLRIGKSIRQHFGENRSLEDLPDGWESDFPIDYQITKYDSDLPCYCHEVEIDLDGLKVSGFIVGDHGIRTGAHPILKLA